MFINILYDCALILLAIAALPRLIYQMAFHRKYRKSLLQRFGLGFPAILKNGKKLIWVHAVSVGETKAIASLVKKIKKEENNAIIVLSTVTETGFAEGNRTIPEADFHVFLPFDFQWIIKPIIMRTAPDMILLCETDFWPNFLKFSKKQGAKILLINGKLSERSLKHYLSFPALSKKMFSFIDLFCVQSKHYCDRFEQLGIPSDKIITTGNIKFDEKPPLMTIEEKNKTKGKFRLSSSDQVLIAGSTHDPEEKILLDALKEVWRQIPNLSVVIVPRHPERFEKVAYLLEQQAVPYRKFSRLEKGTGQEKVILVDAMGLLRDCYQIADLAIVAGSFTPRVGGHNIMEPSWYGVPVLFGPHMHAQPELLELMNKRQAGLQVEAKDLSAVLIRLLSHPEERKIIGEKGLQMVRELAGATERTYQAIKSL